MYTFHYHLTFLHIFSAPRDVVTIIVRRQPILSYLYPLSPPIFLISLYPLSHSPLMYFYLFSPISRFPYLPVISLFFTLFSTITPTIKQNTKSSNMADFPFTQTRMCLSQITPLYYISLLILYFSTK